MILALKLANRLTPGMVMKLILLKIFLRARVVCGAAEREVEALDEYICY